MSYLFSFFSSKTFLLLLIAHFAVSDDQTQKSIDKICNEFANRSRSRSDFVYCEDFFHQNTLPPAGSPDLGALTAMTIRKTVVNTSRSLALLKNLRSSVSPNVAKLLSICEKDYSSLLDKYSEAASAFADDEYSYAHSIEIKCPRLIIECQRKVDLIVPQMKEINRQMDRLVRMSIVATEIYLKNITMLQK